ncbi:unnamed protein product [Orchesella dallaii]|uniref:Uncharacterized protein n=1 Tax=Orchesella dallaii TaxID=48710 RepID=A0ABP1QC75_9HEXA
MRLLHISFMQGGTNRNIEYYNDRLDVIGNEMILYWIRISFKFMPTYKHWDFTEHRLNFLTGFPNNTFRRTDNDSCMHSIINNLHETQMLNVLGGEIPIHMH